LAAVSRAPMDVIERDGPAKAEPFLSLRETKETRT
jgi:hypothetical protein